jgi:hypothetical protein
MQVRAPRVTSRAIKVVGPQWGFLKISVGSELSISVMRWLTIGNSKMPLVIRPIVSLNAVSHEDLDVP